jgi:hypothetical protein
VVPWTSPITVDVPLGCCGYEKHSIGLLWSSMIFRSCLLWIPLQITRLLWGDVFRYKGLLWMGNHGVAMGFKIELPGCCGTVII